MIADQLGYFPAAGFVAGAAVDGFVDEGLDDENGFAVGLKPVIADPPQHEAKDARGQVGKLFALG